jgi:peptidoglycan biosynthesis protein MviN/MurJ (putative lipid II flippase)
LNRRLALLIAIIGGAALGYVLLLVVAGGVLGVLWLYVFGDDPWPAWTDYVLGGAVIAGGLASWGFCSWMLWRALKPREP